MEPYISVLMPVYNGQLYLKESIESILNQTYENFEFIIIDDGSTDGSNTIIRSYSDKRINIITQQNRGDAVARNAGLKITKGKYIAIMDCDDVSEFNRLEIQSEYLDKNHDCVAVGSNAKVIDKNGDYVFTLRTEQYPNESMLKSFNSPFIHSSVMFKRSIINEIKGYDKLPIGSDTVFFLKVRKFGKLANINKELIKYRLSPSSISMNDRHIKKRLKNVIKQYTNMGKLSSKNIQKLSQLLKKQRKHDGEFNYYLLLAKKYLWDNHNTPKVRVNLKCALKIKPLSIVPIMLFILSYLPRNLLKFFYKILKHA